MHRSIEVLTTQTLVSDKIHHVTGNYYQYPKGWKTLDQMCLFDCKTKQNLGVTASLYRKQDEKFSKPNG